MNSSGICTPLTPPELLSPAGDSECLRAAVENGADAVYFGLESGFNARARATNFSLENLPEILQFLHRRCVRGYLTLNTLAFSSELPELERIVRQVAIAGVDAILVQDLGVAALIHEIVPDLAIHASTQMTLTSSECIEEARRLGIRRVVLPRELSLEEIRSLHRDTPVELEAFVHGALCVAYSGQCLTSESLGGRSANRGQCAQACRLPYELICDGELRDFGNQQYLLSPQDLAAYPLTRELIEAGVSCFKIEGRLKSAEYVANITRHYRSVIDDVIQGRPVSLTRRQVQEMEQSFSRGFSPGWLEGCDHKRLVPATSSAKRGVLLGQVVRVMPDRVAVELDCAVQAGDGIVFDGDRYRGDEQGGRVYQVLQNHVPAREAIDRGIVELQFDWDQIDLRRIEPGQRIWKTDDPRLNRLLRQTYENADPQRRIPIFIKVRAETGRPLEVHARAANGSQCRVTSEQPLEAARKHPLSEAVLGEQLSRLGGTVYRLEQLTAEIVGAPMVPLSVLGSVRRQMIEQLNASLPSPSLRIDAENPLARLRERFLSSAGSAGSEAGCLLEDSRSSVLQLPGLTVLCRTLEQVRAMAESHWSDVSVRLLIADFQDIREYREAIELARAAGLPLFTTTPRIQKPDEIGLFRLMQKQNPDGVLVRNLSGLAWFRSEGVPVAGDYSLNVTNELTAAFLRHRGLYWLTPSYDLNREQLMELIQTVPPEWLEVVIHQHMPMFHMEHCVFCAMLSPGTNKSNCGRPCDHHAVELRDRTGMEHPLIADVGCRNTLFNAVAQSSAEIVPMLLDQGITRFRIELVRESAAEIRPLVELYHRLLAGKVSGESVWKSLNAANRVGVTRGTLEPRRNPLAIL